VERVRPALLRGFDQEYLPHEQLQFQRLVEVARRSFERFGFLPIETPSAERAEVLTSKGGAEKEIYALRRLAAGEGEDEAAAKGALRFDLTVPLARYVAMRERELAFPFRRYQIQRVWRGETPQANKGRFREFYQCDIDIINRERLSLLAEAEIPSVIYSVFREMAIGEFRIRINNRKVLRALLERFEVPEAAAAAVLRILDKVEKEPRARIQEDLERAGVRDAARLYEVISDKRDTRETLDELDGLRLDAAAVQELRDVAAAIRKFGVPESAFAIDLGVVRGLDYYTGTIYETTLARYPELGSICSGGRYDDLASYFTRTRLPGVGISIGLTRLFSRLKDEGVLPEPVRTPAEVLVTAMDAAYLDRYLDCARELRQAGINTEVYLEAARFDKHLQYADRKRFRVALIVCEKEFAGGMVQLKNLATKAQREVSSAAMVAAVKEMLNGL
jgi:histidyl-tRNA synthetase